MEARTWLGGQLLPERELKARFAPACVAAERSQLELKALSAPACAAAEPAHAESAPAAPAEPAAEHTAAAA